MNIRSCCLMLLIVLIVPACVPAPTPTRKDWMYSDIMVGFIQAGSEGEWRTANTASFKETAQQLGITLNFYDAQFKPENQTAAFRDFTQDPDVNVIVLAALEPIGWDELMKQAQAAGKVVILEDQPIDAPEDLYATYVGSDFVEEGCRAAIEMCNLLEGSEKKNVWELAGSAEGSDAYKANERSQGFREKIGECGITITQSPIANDEDPAGKTIMEAYLKKDTNIQGLFTQSSDMALAAIQVIKTAGLRPGIDIKIVTIDATPVVFNAMLAGELNVSVEYNPLLAPQVYEAAFRALNGETLPKWIHSQEGFFYPDGVKRILDHSHP